MRRCDSCASTIKRSALMPNAEWFGHTLSTNMKMILDAREVDPKHTAPVSGADERFAHPEEVVDRAIGRPLVCGRPGRASIFAREHAYLRADVQQPCAPWVHGDCAHRRRGQTRTEIR